MGGIYGVSPISSIGLRFIIWEMLSICNFVTVILLLPASVNGLRKNIIL